MAIADENYQVGRINGRKEAAEAFISRFKDSLIQFAQFEELIGDLRKYAQDFGVSSDRFTELFN